MSHSSGPHTELFNRLREGKLSPQDVEELISWLGQAKLDPEAAALILNQLQQSVDPGQVSPAVSAALEARLPLILHRQKHRGLLRSLQAHRIRYAAAILLLVGCCTYFLLNKQTQPVAGPQPFSHHTDLPPGKNGAILTLADGSKVVLDSLGNGVIATQNGAKVLLQNGQVAYSAPGREHSPSGAEGAPTADVTYNMMTTPKGRQFRLVLPDGTRVWLNAASSLRYPTLFAGTERKVEITGEAYFEVAQDAKMPFIVKVNETTEIQVLGTHFNVNSYNDEATINTTLLEGSVRIAYAGEKAVLEQGQQAQVNTQPSGIVAGQLSGGATGQSANGPIKIVRDVNVEKVVAWKNGVFDFEDASLEQVMRQLERWYDIEVVYEKNIPKLEFIGKMGRDLTLSNVLRGLELSKVHFRMEGERKLVILP